MRFRERRGSLFTLAAIQTRVFYQPFQSFFHSYDCAGYVTPALQEKDGAFTELMWRTSLASGLNHGPGDG
jgi:hypothetical protein